MTTTFADLDLNLEAGFDVYEGASIYQTAPVVSVALSRNGFPLADAEFYAEGGNTGTDGILSPEAAELLADLLDLGWKTGTVDGVDFKVV